MKEKGIFIELYENVSMFKVLDFFMVHEDFDYSMTDIAKFSGVGYSTLRKLKERNLVVLTSTVGKAKMYKINLRNPVVKDFKKFY